jgi:hypothetical protein
MIIPFKIGAQLFAVHKSYVDNKLNNGKIIVGKIKSYHNINGKVYPIIKEIGTSYVVDARMYYIYADLGKAIEAITTEKKSKYLSNTNLA